MCVVSVYIGGAYTFIARNRNFLANRDYHKEGGKKKWKSVRRRRHKTEQQQQQQQRRRQWQQTRPISDDWCAAKRARLTWT